MSTTNTTPTWTADDLGITSQIFLELLTDGIVEDGETIVMSRKTAPREDGKRSGFLPSRWPRSATSKKDHVSIGLQRETTDGPGQGGGQSSKLVNWTGMWALVLDDVLEKVPAPKGVRPTVIIETKPGSQQWWFVFELPVRDRELAEKLVQAAIDAGLSDPGMSNVIRWARLPGSQPAGKQFKARVVHWEPGLLFTPETVISALGLTLPKWDYWDAHSDFDISEMGARVDDPVLAFMEQQGMIEGMSGRDWVVIECPRCAEHSDQNERVAYYTPLREHGGGVFKCFHGHDGSPPTQAEFISHLTLAGAPKATTDALVKKATTDTTELAGLMGIEVQRDNVTPNRDAAPVVPRELGEFIMNKDPDPKVMEHYQDTKDFYEGLDFLDWVFVQNTGVFRNRKTGQKMTKAVFDTAMLPATVDLSDTGKGKKERKPSRPSEYFVMVVQGKQVADEMYRPDIAEQFFMEDGLLYLNTFKSWLTPVPVPGETGELCKAHLQNLFPNDWREIERWLAFQVQFPGKRVGRVLTLVGVEGDGKTTISQMLTAALHSSNVKIVSESMLEDKYDGWIKGAQVSVFEEILIAGDKYKTKNKLKPLITNDTVGGRAMYSGEFQAKNTTNYMALTNYMHAVPMTDGDTRWEVYKTRFNNKAHFASEPKPAYWGVLLGAIADNPGEVRHWLLNVDLTGFDPTARATMTDAKRQMIEETRPEASLILEEILSEGHPNAHPDVLTLRGVLTRMENVPGSRHVLRTTLSKILKEEGWLCTTKRIRYGDRSSDLKENIYYHPSSGLAGRDDHVIKAYLDAKNSQNLEELAQLMGTSNVVPLKPGHK